MVDDSDLGAQIEQAVGDAIDEALSKDEGGFVTKWIALIEFVSIEGSRKLWTLASDEVMSWDAAGMLQHAVHLQMRQTINGDGEDGE